MIIRGDLKGDDGKALSLFDTIEVWVKAAKKKDKADGVRYVKGERVYPKKATKDSSSVKS